MKKQFVLKSVPVSFVHDSEYDRLTEFASKVKTLKDGFARYLLDEKIPLTDFEHLEELEVKGTEEEYAYYYIQLFLGSEVDRYLKSILRVISYEAWYTVRNHQAKLAGICNETIEIHDKILSDEIPEFLVKKYARHKGESKPPIKEYWDAHYMEKLEKLEDKLNSIPNFGSVNFSFAYNDLFWYEDYEGHFKTKVKNPYKALTYKIKINKFFKSDRPIVLTVDMNDYLRKYWNRYEKGNPALYCKNGEFHFSIPFRVAERTRVAYDKIPDDAVIVGIDLGINTFISTSTGRQYNTPQLEHTHDKTQKRRRQCQRKNKKNKNRYSVRQHLLDTERKRAELQKHKIYNVANKVVQDLIQDLKGKTIVVAIESLKGLSKSMDFDRRHLKKNNHLNNRMRLAYDQFFGAFKDRLMAAGIHMFEVFPSYTSKTDSRGLAGGERGMHGDYKLFTGADGYIMDADLNGANNIARKFARKKSEDRNFTLAFSPQKGIMRCMKVKDRSEEKGYLDALFKQPKKAEVL